MRQQNHPKVSASDSQGDLLRSAPGSNGNLLNLNLVSGANLQQPVLIPAGDIYNSQQQFPAVGSGTGPPPSAQQNDTSFAHGGAQQQVSALLAATQRNSSSQSLLSAATQQRSISHNTSFPNVKALEGSTSRRTVCRPLTCGPLQRLNLSASVRWASSPYREQNISDVFRGRGFQSTF